MWNEAIFRTMRLRGRAPALDVVELYAALHGAEGPERLDAALAHWQRDGIAPWTLSHAGHDVGVGGFSPEPQEPALRLTFHFLPQVWGQGLAREFVGGALAYAGTTLNADKVIAVMSPNNAPSLRVLEKAGFVRGAAHSGDAELRLSMRLATSQL